MTALLAVTTDLPNFNDCRIISFAKYTGNRLFTINNIDREFGLGSWGVVASYDNGFIITSNPSLIKMDSLGNFQYAQ